ncbi:MAG: hypothetical protein ACFNWZ_00900 [Candidatus Absconditicoccaceae bacterium]
MDLTTARDRAINKFNKLARRDIECPALGAKVKFNNEGFSHITYKDEKHRRAESEQIIRFQCFLDVEEVIKKSHLYQEHMEKDETIKVRKYGETKKEVKTIEYFGLVAVIDHHGTKSRIKVVLRKEKGKDHAEYHSVIPAWNTQGYRNFMGSLT